MVRIRRPPPSPSGKAAVSFPDPEREQYQARVDGSAPTGYVDLYDYDEGVVVTLGATKRQAPGEPDGHVNYYIDIQDVAAPPGQPGIPVVFAYPEDTFEKLVLPTFIVRRDDISADMQRWHPGAEQYRAPAKTSRSSPVSVGGQAVSFVPDIVEIQRQGEPNDLMYSIIMQTRHRAGVNAKREANAMLRYVMGKFQVYGSTYVRDSVGDWRTYETFREGISIIDDLPEVAGRVIGFAVTIRVEAELDLIGPIERRTARETVLSMSVKE